ncbi:DUF6756 family protein [Capnocytophaga leadbetteri]|jgi:hypothetical protein
MIKKENTWTSLRKEIAQLMVQLQISKEDFRPLGLEEWKAVETHIYKTFCKNQKYRRYWLWEDFSEEAVAYRMPHHNPEYYLDKLIDNQEEIFFIFAESENCKFWFYEGKITPVLPLIGELYHYDEFYFISKKYEWLIGINHHDALIATGSKVEALDTLYNNEMMNSELEK